MKSYILSFLIYILSVIGIPSLYGQIQNDLYSNREVQSTAQQVESPLHEFPDDLDSFFKRDEKEKESDTFRAKFTNMLGILGLLIGFMLLASWAIKRMMKTRVTQMNTESAIKVLETRALSPKSVIYLLDVMGQGILIAESNAGVHQLTKVHLNPSEEESHTPPTFEK